MSKQKPLSEKKIRASISWRPYYDEHVQRLANRHTDGSKSRMIELIVDFYLSKKAKQKSDDYT